MEQSQYQLFYLDQWQVIPAEGEIKQGDITVHLEPKAMEVLVYLASRSGQVVTREQLEEDVWHGALVGYDAVTNTIIKLRKALNDNARNPQFIATIPKKGYQLIAEVTFADNKKSDIHKPTDVTTLITEADHKPVSQTRYSLSIAGLVIVIISLAAFVMNPDNKSTSSKTTPSIIVLPFINLSDDNKQEYLADGITEDIITDLSRLSNIMVLASNTSFSYKGKQVLDKDIGTELHVDYVLRGSLRPIGAEIRLTTQLIDTQTGSHVWAERYDRKLTELFVIQDEVLKKIINALSIKLSLKEKLHLTDKSTDNLKAYDYFQEGQKQFKISTPDGNIQAKEYYRKAIELDPGYGRAYGALAIILVNNYRRGWTATPLEELDRALVLAKKAVALDSSIPQTYWAQSFTHLARKEYEQAENVISKAIQIAPNYADGYALLSIINAYKNKPEIAIKLNNKAIKLNPFYSFEYLVSYGIAYYSQGKYKKAIEVLEQAHLRNPNHMNIKILLTASYVGDNRMEDAEWIATELKTMQPVIKLSELSKTMPLSNNEIKTAFINDLRKSGMEE